MFDQAHLLAILPEITLAVGAMALLMVGVGGRDEERGELVLWLAVAVLVLAGIFVATGEGTVTLFTGSFIVDPYARMLKLLALVGATVALIMSLTYWRDTDGGVKFEYPVLLLFAATGMLMMISAYDLIALYVGLELQSLALYVVAAFKRDSARSSEAGLKYFVLGALSSGMLLYGASLVYGFTGSTEFAQIAGAVQPSGANLGSSVWCSCSQASPSRFPPCRSICGRRTSMRARPTPVAAFFAAAPKIAAMALLVRVVISAFPAVTTEWQQIVIFLAIASMALGSFAAIGQRNIKRLMAYSSIGHMGYALVGLAPGTAEGVQGVIVYLAIYLVMTSGTFAFILSLRRDGKMVEEISQLSGLSRTSPLMALMLAILLFSLAGIPPLAGFFAKFYVFLAAIESGLYALAVIGVLLSVVGAFYYLRIVKIMYFDEPVESFEPMPRILAAVLGTSGVLILFFFIYPAPLVAAAGVAAKSLF
nr:NADH-quinone oxidoreductase subunit N [Methyloceanibacter marginalis]